MNSLKYTRGMRAAQYVICGLAVVACLVQLLSPGLLSYGVLQTVPVFTSWANFYAPLHQPVCSDTGACIGSIGGFVVTVHVLAICAVIAAFLEIASMHAVMPRSGGILTHIATGWRQISGCISMLLNRKFDAASKSLASSGMVMVSLVFEILSLCLLFSPWFWNLNLGILFLVYAYLILDISRGVGACLAAISIYIHRRA